MCSSGSGQLSRSVLLHHLCRSCEQQQWAEPNTTAFVLQKKKRKGPVSPSEAEKITSWQTLNVVGADLCDPSGLVTGPVINKYIKLLWKLVWNSYRALLFVFMKGDKIKCISFYHRSNSGSTAKTKINKIMVFSFYMHYDDWITLF